MSAKSTRLWNSQFVNLLLIDLSFQFGIYFTSPIVSNYTVFLGATVAIGGFIAGLHSATAMMMRPIMGFIADRFRKISLLFFAAVLFTLGSIGGSLATDVVALGLSRVVMGVGFALRTVVITAFVSLVVPKEKLGQGVGWVGLAGTVSNALAPMIGEAIGSRFGFHVDFIITTFLFMGGIALVIIFNFNSREAVAEDAEITKRGSGEAGRRKISLSDFMYIPAVKYAVLGFLASFPYGTGITMMFLAAESVNVSGAGVYFTAFALMAMVSKPLAGRISDRYGVVAAAVPAALIMASGMAVLAFMTSYWHALAGGVLMGLGEASFYSAIQAESVRNVPKECLGRAVNTFYIGPDVANGLGPLLSGWLLQTFGMTVMFLTSASAGVIAVVLLLAIKAKEKNAKKSTEEGAEKSEEEDAIDSE